MKNDKTSETTYIVKTLADGKSSNLITEIQKLEIIREFKTKQTLPFYFGFMLGILLVLFISILSKKGYMQAFFETLQAFFKALF